MVYLGIDPGLDGGYAILYENAIVCHQLFRFNFEQFEKDLLGVFECLHTYEDEKAVCYIEQQWPFSTNSKKSNFLRGQSYGSLLAFLKAYEIPVEVVSAMKWKKELGLTSDKQKSIATAQKLFKNVNLEREDYKRKPKDAKLHDGKAEALLIAEYGRRNYGRRSG